MFEIRNLLIWSENPDKLMKFYEEVLGLEKTLELKLPDDYGYLFSLGENKPGLWIGKHSDLSGKNKDSKRIMFDVTVDSVGEWYEKIIEANCEIIAKPFKSPDSSDEDPRYVCTWLDPEGNCWQFVGGE